MFYLPGLAKIVKRKELFQGQQYPAHKLLFPFHRFLLFLNLILFKNNNVESSKYAVNLWQLCQYSHFKDKLLYATTLIYFQLFSKLGSIFLSLNLFHYSKSKPNLIVCLDRNVLKAVSGWPLAVYKERELTTTIFPSTSLLFIVASLPFHFCTCTNDPFSKVTTLCKFQEKSFRLQAELCSLEQQFTLCWARYALGDNGILCNIIFSTILCLFQCFNSLENSRCTKGVDKISHGVLLWGVQTNQRSSAPLPWLSGHLLLFHQTAGPVWRKCLYFWRCFQFWWSLCPLSY